MIKTSVVLYKTLVIGVIILFCGIVLSPSIIADDEARDNPEDIQEYDDYKEIITIINADVWEVKGKGRAFMHRDVEIIARYGEPFKIWGLKRPNENGLFFREKVEYLKAPFFIGLIFSQPPNFASAIGVVFGNIEWS